MPEEIREYNCLTLRCPSNEQLITKAISSSPQVLCLHLKRFAVTGGTGNKVHTEVGFGKSLSLQNLQNLQNMDYSLYAVVCHKGHSLASGHYVVYLKSNNQWYCMDDDNVTRCTFTTVKAQGETSYLLFYEKTGGSTLLLLLLILLLLLLLFSVLLLLLLLILILLLLLLILILLLLLRIIIQLRLSPQRSIDTRRDG